MNSIWSYFIQNDGMGIEDRLESALSGERVCSDAEWEWMIKTENLKHLQDFIVEKIDGRSLLASITPTSRSYRITISPTKDFPKESPIIDCDFQTGFQTTWDSTVDDSLLSLVSSYIELVKRIDIVINALQACEGFTFSLDSFYIDDDESDCITAQLHVCATDEVLRIVIDLENPFLFPRSLQSSIPNRFRGLHCQNWDEEQSLLFNLEAVFQGADQHSN